MFAFPVFITGGLINELSKCLYAALYLSISFSKPKEQNLFKLKGRYLCQSGSLGPYTTCLGVYCLYTPSEAGVWVSEWQCQPFLACWTQISVSFWPAAYPLHLAFSLAISSLTRSQNHCCWQSGFSFSCSIAVYCRRIMYCVLLQSEFDRLYKKTSFQSLSY